MSKANLAELFPPQGDEDQQDLYLGPAQVIEPAGREVELRLEGGSQVTAQLALALPYVAARGDTVVVIGKGNRHYVVGVLDGHGRTALCFRGDVQLRSVGGSLELSADRDVCVKGQKLELKATNLHVIADEVVQKCSTLYQKVRGLLTVRAQRTQTVVDQSSLSKSRSTTILAEEAVTIDGKSIDLG
jgi:hypothetical protein